MHVVRTETAVAAGRAAAYLAVFDALVEGLKQHPGFVGTGLGNSTAYPGKYTALIRFENREAAGAWGMSPVFTAWADAHPRGGIGAATRPIEGYELIEEVRGPAEIRYAIFVDWTLNAGPGNAQAFEDSRRELFALRKRLYPELGLQRLLRFLGPGNRYLVMGGASEPFGPLSRRTPEEVQRFLDAHPYTAYAPTPPGSEMYDAVRVVNLAPV